MQKLYFIHNGTQEEGPFTISELKQRRVTAKTMVWFEGIQAWTEAGYIPELKEIVVATPPPFGKANPSQNTTNDEHNNVKDLMEAPEVKIAPAKKNNALKWGIASSVVLSIILYVGWSFHLDSVKRQHLQYVKYEKQGLRKNIDSLEQLEYQLQQTNAELNSRLYSANANLRSVCEFHLLRTSSEREYQIEAATSSIKNIQQSLANLKEQYTEVDNKLKAAKTNLFLVQFD
jgi:hypothetical protein